MPEEVAAALRRFLIDKSSGNIQLNIKQGIILGFHVTEIRSL
jgi:hypothetical protein